MTITDEIQDHIVQKIQEEYPRLRLETVCDIADIAGGGWDWNPEYVGKMENYVETSIEIINIEDFKKMDEELYGKALMQDPESVMDFYLEYLMNRYDCVIWIDEAYCPGQDIPVKVAIWCD